ncbi:MAG: TIGR00252 family protein [Parcubacteria group bacterium Gr01-1014_33]|nr:MAG: TIGR00252 family protein [Parcubacteria group bacterium Gr01-1014_33]
MPSQKRKFGDAGERIAQRYLTKKGYTFIEKNYQKPWGEIDLVFKRGELIVFVEVKTRDLKNVEHYLAEYSVNYLKIKKLQKICETYLMERRCPYNQKWQIDVIAIAIDKIRKKAKIKHIENAVWERPY